MTDTNAPRHEGDRSRSGELAAALTALVERVQGPVFVPEDSGYDAERSGFQTAFRQRPDVIVGAAGAEDVRLAVEFAAAHGLPVAVQATGHASAEAADGGVLITTRRMDTVQGGTPARPAWAEAGVDWEAVEPEATAHGLAPLNGSAPHVGVVA